MKRDLDLCREILWQIEAREDPISGLIVEVEGRSPNEINYNLYLLDQAGLIQAINMTSGDGLAYVPLRLTWAGHEFLDAARDDTRWNKVKGTVLEKTGGLSFAVVQELLISATRTAVGLG